MPEISISRAAATKLRRLALARRQTIPETIDFLMPRLLEHRDRPPAIAPEAIERCAMEVGVCADSDKLSSMLEAYFRRFPKKIRTYHGPADVDLEFGSDRHGAAYVRLPNGRVFFSPPMPAEKRERKGSSAHTAFDLLRDRLPAGYTIEQHWLSSQVQMRYLAHVSNPSAIHLAPSARIAVEGGAYVGWRSIAMADIIGPEGTVVAIEMLPENYALLCKNIEANGMQGRIIPVQATLNDASGLAPHYKKGFGRQGNTIVPIDKAKPTECEIETTTLNEVFSRLGLGHIDYLSLQLNGAEAKALAGLGDWTQRIDTFLIACPYTRDGKSSRDTIVRLLKAHGLAIYDKKARGRVVAHRGKMRRFVDSISSAWATLRRVS